MKNTNDITTSLNIPALLHLDRKTVCLNEETLKQLGPNNHLAYTYPDSLQVICQLEKTVWEWREVEEDGMQQGLLTANFTYPNGIIVDGIDYSLKSYNFFTPKSLSKLSQELIDLSQALVEWVTESLGDKGDQAAALDAKVDKVEGRSLVVDAEIAKLANLDIFLDDKVDKVVGKSLVADAEIAKLKNLDNTKDIDKPLSTAQAAAVAERLLSGGYTGTAKDLEDLITSYIQGITGGSPAGTPSGSGIVGGPVIPTDTPSGSGIASWIALAPGTYTNFGGVVVNANSIAVISRDASNGYSITQTELVLTDYVKTTYLLDKIDDINYVFEKQIDGVFQNLPLTLGNIDLSGNILGEGTDGNWQHTDFLRIKPQSNITYSGTQTRNDILQVAFYDIKKNFISGVAGGTDGSVTTPIGAYYVRFCCLYTAALTSVINFSNLITLKQAIKEKISISDVQDILDSHDIEKPLSANQGRILNEKIELVNSKPAKNYNYDINHFINYGEGLGQGDWEPNIVSNIQKYNSLMFTGGIRVWENRNHGTIYNALVPAIETTFIYAGSETVIGAPVRGETPCSGMADKIVELIRDEDGFSYTDQQYQMLVSAPGMGGTIIGDLADLHGIYYLRLLQDVTNGKRLAEASGKTYWCPAVAWMQGGADVYENMSKVDYYNLMEGLFNNLNNDIKAITGQTDDVNFFLYQTESFDWYYGEKFTYPDMQLAQLQISLDKPNVHMVTPIYHLPLLDGVYHFNAIGSKWLGGYFGIAYKRVIIDKKPFRPINLISKKVVGNIIYLKFEAPVYPLKFDTVNVPDLGVSKGFQIREVAERLRNIHLNIITNVEINKYDTIKITCSSSPVGKKLTYAIDGASEMDMSSGNLRDSQDIKFLFKNAVADGQETSHAMYNWCPLFEVLL